MTPTPAPWTVTVWDQTVFIHGGPDNDDIADFSFADEVLQDSYISKDEAIANATLCAGAHDLLAASQAVIAAWNRGALTHAMLDPIADLLAAISKATVKP
jgi:hypothetical protein